MAGKIGVIIPAAGAGKRLGGVSKPLLEVGGKPIILRLLSLFSELDHVARICVAVPKAGITEFKKVPQLADYRGLVEFVEGGTERALSVRNAYESISSVISDDDLVCIHDAARPLLSPDDLERVIEAAWKHKAAFLASKVKDTLKAVDEDGFCVSTVDRRTLFAAQTPQVMISEFLKRAYRDVSDCSGLTDEIMLMEKIGVRAYVVEPRHLNFKVTTSDDLDLLKKIIP